MKEMEKERELRELSERWKGYRESFDITRGDSEVEGAYDNCIAELEALLSALPANGTWYGLAINGWPERTIYTGGKEWCPKYILFSLAQKGSEWDGEGAQRATGSVEYAS